MKGDYMIYSPNTPPMLTQIGKKLEKSLKGETTLSWCALDPDGAIFVYKYKPYTYLGGWNSKQMQRLMWKFYGTPQELKWIKENWKQCLFELGDKT
jgi:hypothetical protein